MDAVEKRSLWFQFCERHGLGSDPAPLFSVTDGRVDTVAVGSANQIFLKRSAEMERLMQQAATLVIRDHSARTNLFDGLIYCMFEVLDGRPHPLYIGKAGKIGTSGRDVLSANIKGLDTRQTRMFGRWGYGYAYHFGNLSAVVLDHTGKHQRRNYTRWADELFDKPFDDRRLRRPVYFWAKAWSARDAGPWQEFGETRLVFLEHLLIGITSGVFPSLLNSENDIGDD